MFTVLAQLLGPMQTQLVKTVLSADVPDEDDVT